MFQIYINSITPNNFCSFPKIIERIKWDNKYKNINCTAMYKCKGIVRMIIKENENQFWKNTVGGEKLLGTLKFKKR